MKKETKSRSRRKGDNAENDTQAAEKKPAQKKKGKKKSAKTAKSSLSKTFVWLKFVVVILLVAALVSFFLLDFSRVSSNAMMPNFSKGDLIASWAPIWGFEPKDKGETVLLYTGKSDMEPNVLRVLGMPGDEVAYKDDELTVNGKKLERVQLTNPAIARPDDEPEIWREKFPNAKSYRIMIPKKAVIGPTTGKIEIKDGYFLAGDNRMASYDSRQNGICKSERIKGRVLVILESSRNDGVFGHWLKWPE